MPHFNKNLNAGARCTVRVVPVLILLIFALSVYIVVGRLCIDFIYKRKHQHGVATAFLTLFFFFFLLTIATYLRTYITVQRDPGLVPIAADFEARQEAASKSRKSWCRRRDRDVEESAWTPPDLNPDSPGLEAFYSKDVFVCEADGRPKWCSQCRRWKPDRAHHSSDLGRCVRKMDHFCPWVGGMVSETSYNFFTQFTFYCTFFCIMCLVVGAYSLRQQHIDGLPVNGWALAAVILASIFGTFSCGMALTSFRFILKNETNVDRVRRTHVTILAVRIPRSAPMSNKYISIVYPIRTDRRPQNPEGSPNDPLSIRDQWAERQFAILRTQSRENPWDLGFRENWKSVMGNNVLEWLLPLRHSPCCNHDSMESDYKFGPLVAQIRKRYGAPDLHASTNRSSDGIEMQTVRKERSH